MLRAAYILAWLPELLTYLVTPKGREAFLDAGNPLGGRACAKSAVKVLVLLRLRLATIQFT
jgi:hypothetical protein